MTYSIVARDADAGHMGVATQSQAFELSLNGRTGEALAALPIEELDPAADPDLAWWRAIVLANAGEEAPAARLAQALMTEAPKYAAAARRFGDAGLLDQALIDRLLPSP
ncbi:hypothetical protein CKO31_20565 [Thiohalocapsa halophila]|uniref:Uncharacterized protein n=1 Tax=Thiohalocapsa halophila TaxID=69359 RepID=A0ABS1CMH4_9GAMM|nr:hypothetical protein [Thiohalocapsa halophila]MBK1633100.1 hypothetical protein [Thiohalocapsa halophila]